MRQGPAPAHGATELAPLTLGVRSPQALAALEAFAAFFAAAHAAALTDKFNNEAGAASPRKRGSSPRHASVELAPLPRTPQQLRRRGFTTEPSPSSSSPSSPPLSPSISAAIQLLFPASRPLTPQPSSPKAKHPSAIPGTPKPVQQPPTLRSDSPPNEQQQQQQQQQQHGPSMLIHRRSWRTTDAQSSSPSYPAALSYSIPNRPSTSALALQQQQYNDHHHQQQQQMLRPSSACAAAAAWARSDGGDAAQSLHSFTMVPPLRNKTENLNHLMLTQALPEAKKPPQPAVSEKHI